MRTLNLRPEPTPANGDKLEGKSTHPEDRTIEITQTIPDDVWNQLPEKAKESIQKEQ